MASGKNWAMAKRRRQWLSQPAALELDFRPNPKFPDSERKRQEREMIREGLNKWIVDPEDTRGVAIKKMKNHQIGKPDPAQTDFMDSLYPTRKLCAPLSELREGFEAAAKKRGQAYTLTIGEALDAELARQKRATGQTNIYWALSNLYDYLLAGGKVRVEMTPQEKSELRAEIKRAGKEAPRANLRLTPNTRLIYETLRALRPLQPIDIATGQKNKRLPKEEAHLIFGRAIVATKQALKEQERSKK